jgi:hypothetical protein
VSQITELWMRLSRHQSCARVATENQGGLEVSFQAWTAEPGSWGGGVPRDMTNDGQVQESTPPLTPEISLTEWVDSSEKSPFIVSPPASITQSVWTLLDKDTVSQARANARARMDDTSVRSVLDKRFADEGGPAAVECSSAAGMVPVASRISS